MKKERVECSLPASGMERRTDRDSEAELRVPVVAGVAYHGWGSIEPENHLEAVRCSAVRSVRVPSRRLDSLELDDVGFIKIDVEGHELAVLRGAEQTLSRCRPILLFEAEDRHRPDAVDSVRTYLTAIGYAMTPALSHGMWTAVHP